MSHDTKFSDEKIFAMLELIQQYPAIWCVTHNDYKDKNIKTKATEEAAGILGVSSEALAKKLHNLRSSYRRVIQQKKGKSGDGAFVVKWPFFNAMSYMYSDLISCADGIDSALPDQQKQHQPVLGAESSEDMFADVHSQDTWDTPSPTPSTSLQPQQGTSNMPPSPAPSMTCPSPRSIHSAIPSTSRASSSSRKRKSDNQFAKDIETSSLLSQCRQLINSPIAIPQMKDQAGCFADWIASKMRLLDPHIQNMAEMQISQLLCQIENDKNNIVVVKPE